MPQEIFPGEYFCGILIATWCRAHHLFLPVSAPALIFAHPAPNFAI
jgi:hypothetical protein